MTKRSGAMLLGWMLLGGILAACTGSVSGRIGSQEASKPCAATPGSSDGKPKAADAVVRSSDGSRVPLQSAWAHRTAVIVFYSSHACTSCQRQLAELQKNLDKFVALDATLIAVSADPEDIAKMASTIGAYFELYADPDLGAIRAFDVLHETGEVAKPAVFIVDQTGTVHFRYIGKDMSDRVRLEVLLGELAKVQQNAG